METPVEETGAQKIMVGIKIDRFENGTYSLMFLKNSIQNKATTAEHRSSTKLPSNTIH